MAEIKFEEAMSRLEEIVKTLEEGGSSLDDSVKLFEEGMKLANTCSARLKEAENKIEKLVKIGDEYKREPLDG